MADTRISELPLAAPLSGAEQGVAVQSGATVRFSLQDLPVSIPTQEALDEIFSPPAINDPVNIGDVAFEFTNDTTLTIKCRGSDNIVRSVALTLA